MPLSFSKIAAKTATITLPVDEETVTVVYYPGRITEKTIAQFQAMAAMNESNVMDGYAGFNEALCYLIKSWDVLDDAVDPPVMFPLEPKRMAELPIGFRLQVITAIVEGINPEAVLPHLNGHS